MGENCAVRRPSGLVQSVSPSVSVVGEAAEVSGEVEGHRRGVAAVDGDGHGASAHGVQDMHAAAQEFFGQSLAAVIQVCDEFSDECFPGAFIPGRCRW
jgi:hypothetical protein